MLERKYFQEIYTLEGQNVKENISLNNELINIDVKITSLDLFTKENNIYPDLIKIDVEGAEALVLEGGIQLALDSRPKFFVEMHSNLKLSMKDNVLKILKWSNKVKYTVWYMKERKMLINADEISHRGKCHIHLLPIEM